MRSQLAQADWNGRIRDYGPLSLWLVRLAFSSSLHSRPSPGALDNALARMIMLLPTLFPLM